MKNSIRNIVQRNGVPFYIDLLGGLCMIAEGFVRVISFGFIITDWYVIFLKYKIRLQIKFHTKGK